MTFTWETDQLDFLRTHTWAVSPPVAEVFGALSGNLPPAANDIVAMLD